MQPKTSTTAIPSTWQIAVAFACLYFFWGSTYTAIHFATIDFPVPALGALRFLIAAVIMLAVQAMRGKAILLHWKQLAMLAVIGILLLVVGNGILMWSEKVIQSGFASLIVAIMPICIALIERIIPGGEPIRARGWVGVLLGLAGLLVLLWPELRGNTAALRAQLLSSLLLMFGAFSWACASVLSRRSKLEVDPFVAAGWEMLFAGLLFLILSIPLGSWKASVWRTEGVSAIAYLVVFGSLVGFSAFIWLLHHVPVTKVSTYAYVNPVVAVVLGAIVIHEHMQVMEFAGMAFILLAIYLMTTSQIVKAIPETKENCAAASAET